MSIIRIAGIVKESIVDGPGIRYTVFVQGCPHHCEGCHNPDTHDFSGGDDRESDGLVEEIRSNPLLAGVTLSGGEPFCQAEALCDLAEAVKTMKKNVIAYSGYTFEELLELSNENPFILRLLQACDLLIDGRYIQEKRDLTLRFRGSSNQRVLDVPKSLATGKAVLWDKL